MPSEQLIFCTPNFNDTLPQHSPEILIAHGILLSEKKAFLEAQRIAAPKFSLIDRPSQNFSLYQESSGIFFIRKIFLLDCQYAATEAEELILNYQAHLVALHNIGASQLAKNYNMNLVKKNDAFSFVVDQLFFPNGTALDWIRQNIYVKKITEEIITNHILPVLAYQSPVVNLTDSAVSMDSKLSNFAVVPTADDNLRVFYFDFFPPRIRDNEGNFKTVSSKILDPVNHKEAEYRFLTKPGIIHNLIRRGYYYIFENNEKDLKRVLAWQEFKQEVCELLTPYIELYFPGKTVQEISDTDFSEYIGKFICRR